MLSDRELARRSYTIGIWSLGIGIIALGLALYAVKDPILYQMKIHQVKVIDCPDRMTKARNILAKQSVAIAPDPTVNFTPSRFHAGRVDMNIAWQNPSDLQVSAIAITGVYGDPSKGDERIDSSQPGGVTGACWSWYTYAARNDAQPQTVNILVPGVYPMQRYCYFAAYKTTGGGYSQPSPIKCETAPWQESWGLPDQPN